MADYIEIHTLETTREFVQNRVPDQFRFREDRPLHWLQKACLWILRKLKCEGYVEELKVRTQRVRLDRLIEMIRKHQYDVYPRQIDRLVVGAKQFQQLYMETSQAYNHPFSMEIPPFEIGPDTVCGMRIQMVPWLDGCFILPKMEVESCPKVISTDTVPSV